MMFMIKENLTALNNSANEYSWLSAGLGQTPMFQNEQQATLKHQISLKYLRNQEDNLLCSSVIRSLLDWKTGLVVVWNRANLG